VRIYLDTNVLVAASLAQHPHYYPAAEVLQRIRRGELKGVVSSHVLAEMYSVLTRTPFTPRVYPLEAQRLIQTHGVKLCEVIALTTQHYEDAIAEASENGWIGAKIYDLLHVKAAIQAKCDRLYTFNVQEFRAISGSFAKAVTAP
jgi:predicted nucleic acid-binding protein